MYPHFYCIPVYTVTPSSCFILTRFSTHSFHRAEEFHTKMSQFNDEKALISTHTLKATDLTKEGLKAVNLGEYNIKQATRDKLDRTIKKLGVLNLLKKRGSVVEVGGCDGDEAEAEVSGGCDLLVCVVCIVLW